MSVKGPLSLAGAARANVERAVTAHDKPCRRCGDPYSAHVDGAGNFHHGWRASRFTASGFCNAQHKSGGIAGSVQWCGCTGYEPAP